MKIIIIEDERPAAEKLRKALLKCEPPLVPEVILNSVHTAISWLGHNPPPDLIFMDIELSDGISFTIFKETTINSPVIFTTAFDEYWQEAFEHNSIDYLLKPIRQDKLETAIQKYKKLEQHFSQNYAAIVQQLQGVNQSTGYRKRLLLKKGTDLISIKTDEIAYCYAAHKISFIVDATGQKFIIDKSLHDLEKELDPTKFFRINRKWLVNIQHIKRIRTLSKSKLSLELNPPANEEILISQENTASFKQWISG
ncbi:MAG: LytR/AlgR family response regulator transcription factor [Chitinophagales bacterium]